MVGGDAGADGELRRLSAATTAIAPASRDPGALRGVICTATGTLLAGTCTLGPPATARSGDHELVVAVLGDDALHVVRTTAAFSDRERELAELVAAHAAIALANAEAWSAAAGATASLTRFARLDQTGILGMVVSGPDGKAVEVNQTLADLLGYTRDELLAPGFVWRSLTPPEWAANDERAVVELASDGVAALREKQYITKSGTRVWVMVGSARLSASSHDSLTLSFVLDVTERKTAALRSQQQAVEARSSALIDAAPDALVIVHADGSIALVNRRVERLFGYTRGELIGAPVEVLLPERARAYFRAGREQYMAAPEARLMGKFTGPEQIGLHKDGREFPVEIGLSPIPTPDGILVFAAIRDLAERKRTEAVRYRLAALVESSSDAIIGVDLEGRIASWNHAAHVLYGHREDEAIGQPLAILVPPGADPGHADSLRRHRDGHELEVWVATAPIVDPSGKTIGASVVARDITERRQAERRLAAARDAAESANRELEAFSYSVAHDLRAPLRGVDGFARILLDDHAASLDADGRDCLDEIRASARRMGELIDALLSLSRVTRSELRPRRVDLAGLARAAVRELAAADPARRVELIAPAELEVQGDLLLLRIVIENLVGNAWKFSANQPDARIELGTIADSAAPIFYIRDNGAGFDMAYASKLFAPFQRLHTVREFPGTGIGLATVQRIIHRHGGRIWAEAAVNAGATMLFTLPAREVTS